MTTHARLDALDAHVTEVVKTVTQLPTTTKSNDEEESPGWGDSVASLRTKYENKVQDGSAIKHASQTQVATPQVKTSWINDAADLDATKDRTGSTSFKGFLGRTWGSRPGGYGAPGGSGPPGGDDGDSDGGSGHGRWFRAPLPTAAAVPSCNLKIDPPEKFNGRGRPRASEWLDELELWMKLTQIPTDIDTSVNVTVTKLKEGLLH